jgi:precorrin-2 dehydrogenase/sirohydrochlorin ferrochelatase
MPARRNKKSPSVVYYPVFLNLSGKKAVVVGGGKVAERKVLSLLKAGADITVISPSLTGTLQRKKAGNAFRHHPRNYRKGDLGKAFLVISATDSPALNKKIAKDAPALVNVVDVPPECNFIAPSVVKRGPLTIAVSTDGVSPAFSRTVREELENIYGPQIGDYLGFIRKMRTKALSEISRHDEREKFLKSIASKKIVDVLRTEGFPPVKQIILDSFLRVKKNHNGENTQKKTATVKRSLS